MSSFLSTLFSLLNAPDKRLSSLEPHTELNTKELHSLESVLSIIYNDTIGPPVVANHILDDAVGHLQVLPGATGYKFLSVSNEPGVDDKWLLKHINKSIASLEKLYRLLRSETATEQFSTPMCSIVILGKGAFISSPQLSDEQKASDMTEIYTKVQFQFSNAVTSTQYFNCHCSTIKPALLNEPSFAKFTSIDINSGICLFSSSLLSTSPGHGQPTGYDEKKPIIPPLPRNNEPTIYELEIITRLSSAISDTASLIGNAHRSHNTRISINIDIPDFQYYWTACELFEWKLVSLHYVKNWIAVIDERRRQLKTIMTSILGWMLTDRHLSAIDINITSGTEPAVALIKEKVDMGTTPSFDEIKGTLSSQGEDAGQWKEFLDNLDSRYQPATVGDLGRLTYVFKAVKPALEHQRGPGRRLILQVDDVNEWRVLDRAKTFLKKYSSNLSSRTEEPIIVGLFPMQRIFAAGPGRSDLYLKDPGGSLLLEPESRMVCPLDIITATYGLRVGKQLQLLCRQEGLHTSV